MAISPERLTFLKGAKEPLGERLRISIKRDGDWQWTTQNSDFDHYVAAIATVKEGIRVGSFIRQYLAKTQPRVGLDIAGGADGKALRQLMDEGLLQAGLVTNLDDNRTNSTRADRRLGHVHGNLKRRKTWQKIIDWQEEHAPEGFGLVLHRPDGGLQYLNPDFYRGAANVALDLMSPGGLMYAQVPLSLGRDGPARESICFDLRRRDDVAWVQRAATKGVREHPHNMHVIIVKKPALVETASIQSVSSVGIGQLALNSQ